MSTGFLIPDFLHTAANVLSATSEQELTVAVAVPGTANRGALRPRTSGIPSAVTALDVKMQTGGNPTGYATTGSGAAVVWKTTAQTSSQYSGYNETPFIQRAEFPIPYAADTGIPSTPRELASGSLGILVGNAAAALIFYSISPTGTVTTVTTGFGVTLDTRPDFVVFPSGRLVAVARLGNVVYSISSEDDGATWAVLGSSAYTPHAGHDILCVEFVEDMIVGVFASSTGAAVSHGTVSRDGGCTFASVDATVTLTNPRTCVTVTGTVLVTHNTAGGTGPLIYGVAPGGAFVSIGSTLIGSYGSDAIVTRDDGTVWVFSANADDATHLAMDCAVSIDHGLSFALPVGAAHILDVEFDSNAPGYTHISAGSWRGSIVMLARVECWGGGANEAIHMLTFGAWANVTEAYRSTTTGLPYQHGYVPIERPHNVGWSKSDSGAGVSGTATGPFAATFTGADASYWTASNAVWATATSPTNRRFRFRIKIVSGGTVASDGCVVTAGISDGANDQRVTIRFSATQFRVVDRATGNTIVTVTETMTAWTDFLVAIRHETGTNTGTVAVWHKQDDDALWTNDVGTVLGTNALTEAAGTDSVLRFGGIVPVVTSFEFAGIWNADDDDGLTLGFTNPTALAGRPLSTVADFYVSNRVRVGGRAGPAIPGDTYTVTTTYRYPVQNIWREMRPSKQWRSAADETSTQAILDAGTLDLFAVDTVVLIGTNFRTCTLDIMAAPVGTVTASISLDATIAQFTAGIAGLGYVGPSTPPSWRPHQFRSDGDGHRIFVRLTVGIVPLTFEVTDNDERRLFVEGVDLTTAAGAVYIFGDRMIGQCNFTQERYAILTIASQTTFDNDYRIGTIVMGQSYVPRPTYDSGFIDTVEPMVDLFEADNGSRSSVRRGPRKASLAIGWPQLDRLTTDTEGRLRDMFGALDGSHRPIVVFRDVNRAETIGLYRVEGKFDATNIIGEQSDAFSRVDGWKLTEET